MSEINDYCPVVNETVNILYHTQQVPVLGKLDLQDGKNLIEKCSHSENCNCRLNDCPIFLKLNND